MLRKAFIHLTLKARWFSLRTLAIVGIRFNTETGIVELKINKNIELLMSLYLFKTKISFVVCINKRKLIVT